MSEKDFTDEAEAIYDNLSVLGYLEDSCRALPGRVSKADEAMIAAALKSAYECGKADAAMSEWQPISTAPKDGTQFWGDSHGDAKRMFWHDGFQEFISEFRRMEMAPGYTIDGATFKDHSPVIHKPEWWMPLPNPPTQEASE